ncbi:MAG: sugar phosphate isomerase/epimerase family protein [Bacteroidales bacterium]
MESRREFIKKSAVAGVGLPIMGSSLIINPLLKGSDMKCPVCIFSKHLQFLEDYGDMADAALEAGFDGVDLGVRPGAHVEPERVEEDLPKAVEAIQKRGLKIPMMVTRINDPKDPKTVPVLKTAGQLGIQMYRMAYYKYDDSLGIEGSIEKFKPAAAGLAALNEKYGIRGAYQNHSGLYFGAPVWDLWLLLKDLDPKWIGNQYDICHASIEGNHSWPYGLKLINPYINCVVAKDAKYEKVKGKWKNVYMPLGEGIVDWDAFLGYLKEFGFTGPISLHVEYHMYDEEDKSLTVEQKRKGAIKHMKQDVAFLKNKLKESGLV